MNSAPYLSFDLGASNGRAILGYLENNRLRIEEVNRFANEPVRVSGTLYWNILSLWDNILKSMRIVSKTGIDKLSGIGIDTWGVDFGLFGRDGKLLSNPVHYRDSRTEGIEKKLAKKIKEYDLYSTTGLAFSRVNTLSQIFSMSNSGQRELIRNAKTFLMMPDIFRYFLCGKPSCELTIASSSQLLDINTGKWSRKILKTFGLAEKLMPEISEPVSVAGNILPEIASQTGIKSARVFATAGHDTACAVSAVPVVKDDSAFSSLGTWAVLGIVADKPVISEQALELGFVNEFGLDSMMFVKNMMGLYLVENLKRSRTKRGEKIDYHDMINSAKETTPFKVIVDINSPIFFASENPESAMPDFLKQTRQKPSVSFAEITRTLLEGLAFTYKESIINLEAVTGRKFKSLHIVGGGIRNSLLCQFIADATGIEVIAGPAEATVAGNISMQILGSGKLKSADAIRELVRNSFKLEKYEPCNGNAWEKSYARYLEIKNKKKG